MKRIDFEKVFDSHNIDLIKIDLVGGNVVILNGLQDEIGIKIQWKKDQPESLPEISIKDGVLELKSNDWKQFIGQKNTYIIQINLPKNLDLNIKMFAGVIELKELDNNIAISLRAGEVLGSISLTQNTFIKVLVGSIKLNAKAIYDLAKVNLKCYLGDIKLT